MRQQQYTSVNAFSHPLSLQTIFAIVFVLLQLLVHSLFILPEIFVLEFVSIIVFYILLTIMIIVYIYLLLFDPVDINLKKKREQTQEMNIFGMYKYCDFCQTIVYFTSKHCKICNRCSSDFDHHCAYLNNCIGGRNYKQFIVLLLTTIFFQICFSYQSLRVFVVISKNYNINPLYVIWNRQFYKWILIGISSIGFLILASLLFLLSLHIYLKYVGLSTYDWLKKIERRSQPYIFRINKIKPNEFENKVQRKIDIAEFKQHINNNFQAATQTERQIYKS